MQSGGHATTRHGTSSNDIRQRLDSTTDPFYPPRRTGCGPLLHRKDWNRNPQAHHRRRMHGLGYHRYHHGCYRFVQGLQRPSSHQQVIRPLGNTSQY